AVLIIREFFVARNAAIFWKPPIRIERVNATELISIVRSFNITKRATDLIVDDQSLPPHLKAAMGYLFEMKNEVNDVLARNEQLLQENKLVKEKIVNS
ncbi:hypothetical protein GCK32_001667, partial [Trichostrongylus colubriformis]